MNLLLILSLLITIVIDKCKCNVKTWKSNFDYNNPKNWNQRQIPCANDRIIFAENTVIYLDQPIKAKQVILPKNGQIVFGDKASIILIDNPFQNDCIGKDNKFVVNENNDWFDPYNWNQTVDVLSSKTLINEINFMGSDEYDNPIPHMERIPCAYDLVSFAANTSFKLNVDLNNRITIKQLRIWQKYFDRQDFKNFMNSDVGKQLFTFNGLNDNFVIDDNMICNDPKGCVCGNEESYILDKICNFVNRYGCPSLKCSDPIKPIGHCCPICASMLTFTYKNGFNLDLIQGITTAFVLRNDYLSVRSYLHKLKSQRFQFIAIDLGDKGLADRMVKAIKQYFNDDTYLGPGIYSIDSIQIHSSTDWSTGSAGFWVFCVFLVFLFIGSAVGVSYYIKNKRIGTHFAFARFRGADDGVELQMGTTPHEALDPNSPLQMSTSSVKYDVQPVDDSVTFENPVFTRHHLKDKETENQDKSSELTSVDNPFFSVEDVNNI